MSRSLKVSPRLSDGGNIHLFIDKDAAYVHKWLSYNKFLKADIKFLNKELCGYDNLLEKLQEEKKMFLVAQISDDNYEIRPKVPVDICKSYNESKKCLDKFCKKLHLCKKFLWSPKTCDGEKCGYVHSINTNHNKAILDKVFPDSYSDEVKVKVVCSSFPRICQQFLKTVSCQQPFCGFFHICEDFVNDICGKTCELAKQSGKPKTTMHNFMLNHNKHVFNIFFPGDRSICREEAATNILTAPAVKTPKILTAAASVPDLAYNTSGSIITPQIQLDVKICRFYLENRCSKNNCPFLHLCKELLLDQKSCPLGNCKFNFSHDPLDSHNQPIIQKSNSTLPSYQVLKTLRKSFPRVCSFYQERKCTKKCTKLHVCLNFLQNSVCTSDGCDLSHDVSDAYNKAILDSYGRKFQDLDKNAVTGNVLFSKKRKRESIKLHNESNFDKSVKDWYDQILKSPEGFKNLGSNLQTDTVRYFKTVASDHFRLVQHRGQNLLYACPKDVKPCTQYWRKNNSCNFGSDCSKFHICKKFIFDENGCSDEKCVLQHDFNSKHEQKLIQNHDLKHLSENQIKILLKYRYPIVCIPYLKRACKSPSTCPSVHVCKRYIHNQCKQDGRTCKWAHDGGLRNDHSKRLMKEFHIKEAKFRECIMLSKPRVRSKKTTGLFEIDEIDEVDQSSGDESAESESEFNIVKSNEGDVKPKEEKRKLKGFIGFDTSVKLESSWEPPSEMDVFTFIIQYPYYGQISIGSLQLLQTFFQGHEGKSLKWFEDHPNSFRMDRTKKNLFLCVKDIKLCLDYWTLNGCLGHCNLFHICKESLFDATTEHSGISCGKHHDFSDTHNQRIISKFSLEPLNTRQMKFLLINTLPSVCKEYLKNKCNDLQCEDVHICGDFVNDECLKHSALCSFRHEAALSDSHAEEIMKLFHISNAPLLKKSLVYFKPKSEEKERQEFLQQPTFNFLKDEAICVSYLNDVCDKDENCSLLHPKNCVPYRWQYKKPTENSWKMFPNNLNDEIEKAFCDPTQSK